LRLVFEKFGGCDQISHVGREIGIREVAFALAQPGEVKAQHRDTRFRQSAADVGHGFVVLVARKAMGE
jgi:hypothetical protein